MRRFLSLLVGAVALILALASVAQQALVIRPLAERKVADLPVGELFWRIATYPSKEARSRRQRRCVTCGPTPPSSGSRSCRTFRARTTGDAKSECQDD